MKEEKNVTTSYIAKFLPAGQVPDESLDMAAGVEVLALDLDAGAAGLGPVSRRNVAAPGADKAVVLAGLAPAII